MKSTLSTITTMQSQSSLRLSKQTIHTLDFIHSFRNVTTYHVQTSLGHASPNSTYLNLNRLVAKGYIGRDYTDLNRTRHQKATFFLTPAGLHVLKTRYPERRFRTVRSVVNDADLGDKARNRYHTLANVYVHCKRHHDGRFEFFTAHDLANVSGMPNELPDGLIRMSRADGSYGYYLLEVHGWNRSSYTQKRRLFAYVEYAESFIYLKDGEADDVQLFVVTGGSRSRRRVHEELRRYFHESLASDFAVSIASADELNNGTPTIWRQVRY